MRHHKIGNDEKINFFTVKLVLVVESVLTVCLHFASQGSHRAFTFALT
jgi:hypothetical protein